MNDMIMIEPAGDRRPAFAVWGLAQDPKIQTASASGWLVPVGLYPSVPPELLEGAYVDGFLYDRPVNPTRAESAERISAALDIPAEVLAPAPTDNAAQDVAEGVPAATTIRKRRNRAAAKNGGAE